MPRKKTARKEAEKFVSKVSDNMIALRIEELYGGEEIWQVMLAADQGMRVKFLEYIRLLMELEEINHKIAGIRNKQGVQAALVSIGPRGGKIFSPLHRLRKTKMNQLLQKYRAVSKGPEWIARSRTYGESLSPGEMEGIEVNQSKSPKKSTSSRKRKAAKKKPYEIKIIRPGSSAGESASRIAKGIILSQNSEFNLMRMSLSLRIRAMNPKASRSPEPAGSPEDKGRKPARVSKQDIEKAIKKLQRRLRRKDLLKRLTPAMIALLKIILLSLQGWENDLEGLLGIPGPPQYVQDVINHIARLIEQSNSFDKWFR